MLHPNHIAEQKSRAIFRMCCPDHVVVRDESPDHGYDFQIEVFDPDGHSSGIRILVQLKAISAASEDQTRVRVEMARLLEYALRAPLPVLVVGVQNRTKSCYFAWERDLLDVRSTASPLPDKVVVRLEHMTPLNEEAWEGIERDARRRNRSRDRIGLESRLDQDGSELTVLQQDGQPSLGRGALQAELDRAKRWGVTPAAGRWADILVSGGLASGVRIACRWGSDAPVDLVHIPGLDADCWPIHEGRAFRRTRFLRAVRIGLYVACALFRPGRLREPREVSDLRALDSVRLIESAASHLFGLALVANDLVRRFVGVVVEAPNVRVNPDWWVLFALTRLLPTPPTVAAVWEPMFERLRDATTDAHGKAIHEYNAARCALDCGRWRRAAVHLFCARRYYPEYEGMAHWWDALAIALYESEHPLFASKAYLKAASLEPSRQFATVRAADSLLRFGEVEGAEALFRTTGEYWPDDNYWALRLLLAERLLHFGFRKPTGVDRPAVNVPTPSLLPPEWSVERMLAQTRMGGPLVRDGLFWFNWGITRGNEGASADELCAIWFVCAMIQPWDVQAWCHFFLFGFGVAARGDGDVLPVMQSSYPYASQQTFGSLDEAWEEVVSQQAPSHQSLLLELFRVLQTVADDPHGS